MILISYSYWSTENCFYSTLKILPIFYHLKYTGINTIVLHSCSAVFLPESILDFTLCNKQGRSQKKLITKPRSEKDQVFPTLPVSLP